MNGRIYDPLLGRFLSADLFVQFSGSLQSYNRYSYVNNNPLTLIDPSGFFVDLQGTDEQKKRLQEALDNKFKQKDGTYTKDYQKLLDSKGFGISIKFAEGKTASASASAAGDKAQTTDQPSKDRVADASTKSQSVGKIDSSSQALGMTLKFNSPTGAGTQNVSEVSSLPDDRTSGGNTRTTLSMSYDQDSNTVTFDINYDSQIYKHGSEPAKEQWRNDENNHQDDFSAAYKGLQEHGFSKLPASLSLDKAAFLFGAVGIKFEGVTEASIRFWDTAKNGRAYGPFQINGEKFTGTGAHGGGSLDDTGGMIHRPTVAPAKEVAKFRAALEK